MAEAFNSLGNHKVSDSAAAINAGDDLSTVDGDDSVLGRDAPQGARQRRRRADDDEETDLYDEDDMESLISQPMNGADGKPVPKPEEEVQLPEHACA